LKRAEELEEVKLAMARNAPVLELPVIATKRDKGLVLEVRRVATRFPAEPLAWIETREGEILRLPQGLLNWAFDIVAMVLSEGGNDKLGLFPTHIEFGILNGKAYAEFPG
jgi:hypothetical protein